jgi:hypothetical protein
MTYLTSDAPSPQRRRPRHLMDPNDPRPPVRRPTGGMSLSTVQKWVISTLAVSTILHFSLGLIAAAMYVDESRLDAQVGLNVLAGITGVAAVLAGRAIHGARLLSWWLVLGLAPLPIGLYLTFWI